MVNVSTHIIWHAQTCAYLGEAPRQEAVRCGNTILCYGLVSIATRPCPAHKCRRWRGAWNITWPRSCSHLAHSAIIKHAAPSTPTSVQQTELPASFPTETEHHSPVSQNHVFCTSKAKAGSFLGGSPRLALRAAGDKGAV